ncbi:hypothetical protein EDD80_11511 [Anseongella ginsenosidimutans]|uniref:Uncharacterized protein n=1 Tax=Anseongella ginsenosidimutans TaxID=496056 RepID=A0A4R3KMI8_9SPHI|nr:hypothetical protein [Anseongella ginsenosidimutans]TCS85028.1 hypothetical protein EDD80_11511 [Anseongella ginsenosidimutans]
MRKLKLQMNMALGDKWDDEMTNLSLDNLVNVDNILLGRNTAEDFIPYWDNVAKNPKDDFYTLGKLLSVSPRLFSPISLKPANGKMQPSPGAISQKK